jgi:hypothetical protein
MSPVKDKIASAKTMKKDGGREKMLTVTELAFYVGTPPQVIMEMVEVELISPCTNKPEPCFHTDMLPVVRKLLRIHKSMEIGISSLPLILDLLERIEKIEDQLSRLTGSRS